MKGDPFGVTRAIEFIALVLGAIDAGRLVVADEPPQPPKQTDIPVAEPGNG